MQLSKQSKIHDEVREFALALEELVEFYQTRDRTAVCYYDISASECRALAIIGRGGAVRLKTVAEALKLDKSTTSRIVSSLLKKGYVTSVRDKDDARELRIRANSAGKKIHRQVRMDLIAEYESLLAEYSEDFRRQIPEFLRRVTDAAKRRTRPEA